MTKKLRVNKGIEQLLLKALEAAELRSCGVAKEHQLAMRIYLSSWVVGPLREALTRMGSAVPPESSSESSWSQP